MEGLGPLLPRPAKACRQLIQFLQRESITVAVDFDLYLITDRRQTGSRGLSTVVEQAVRGGIRAVQLREKDLPTDSFSLLAEQLRRITSLYGARLMINGRVDIACEVHADGVHLPHNGVSVEDARNIIGSERLIAVSCHSLESALAAQNSGADFITFGPVFHTPSKAVYGKPLGLERLAEAAAALDIPVFGLGGINESNIAEVMAAGADGIALVSAIIAAEQPMAVAETMLEILRDNRL